MVGVRGLQCNVNFGVQPRLLLHAVADAHGALDLKEDVAADAHVPLAVRHIIDHLLISAAGLGERLLLRPIAVAAWEGSGIKGWGQKLGDCMCASAQLTPVLPPA